MTQKKQGKRAWPKHQLEKTQFAACSQWYQKLIESCHRRNSFEGSVECCAEHQLELLDSGHLVKFTGISLFYNQLFDLKLN